MCLKVSLVSTLKSVAITASRMGVYYINVDNGSNKQIIIACARVDGEVEFVREVRKVRKY